MDFMTLNNVPRSRYTYTRPCPKVTRPRDNVIIRLCAMECNYAAPLSDPSNSEFQVDIVNWSTVSQRIYIWDYITSFANYVSLSILTFY